MAESQCGLLVLDPFNIGIKCCLHLDQPIRLNEEVELEAELTNNETVGVKGTLVAEVVDPETGATVEEIDRQGFNLDAGEEEEYLFHFTPESADIDDDVEARLEEPDGKVVLGTRVYTTDEESLGDEIRGG